MYHVPPPVERQRGWRAFILAPAIIGPLGYGVARLIDRALAPPPHVEVWFPDPMQVLAPGFVFGLTVLFCTYAFARFAAEPLTAGRYYLGCLPSPLIAVACLLLALKMLPLGLFFLAGIFAWMSALYVSLYLAVGTLLPHRRYRL